MRPEGREGKGRIGEKFRVAVSYLSVAYTTGIKHKEK